MDLEEFTSYPLKFRPIAKERIWGGDRLSSFFELETNEKIGEVWTLSDHKNGMSVCENGPLAGKTLTEIITAYRGTYLGETERDCFPLLIKFIHAEQDLSVQIHPDDEYAQKHEGDFGKTESWYILEAEAGARVNYGHSFQDRGAYERAVREERVGEYLQYVDVSEDDFIFVPSRTLHAIMHGVMLIEVQQTSDVTYRVYDWDRVDKDGKRRELHTDKAADVLNYGKSAPVNERKTVKLAPGMKHEHLVRCRYFTIDKWDLSATETISLGKPGQPDILICAKGEGTLTYRGEETVSIAQGDTLLIPADLANYEIRPGGRITLLRAYYE